MFFGDAGVPDRRGVGRDGPRLLAHVAVDQNLDLVGVVRGLLVGLGILTDMRVDVVEQLAHLGIDDLRPERGHRGLEVGEGLVRHLGGLFVMTREQLVGVEPRDHQLLERLAGQDHGVGIAGLVHGPALQLLDLGAQLGAGRIKHVLDQLRLLAPQDDGPVETLRVSLEFLRQMFHLRKPLGILDFRERLCDQRFQRVASFQGGLVIRLIDGVQEFARIAAESDEAAIDIAREIDGLGLLVEHFEFVPDRDERPVGQSGNHDGDREHRGETDRDLG